MNEQMNQTATINFFEVYDETVTKEICKILRFMFLVFPILLVASIAGLFRIPMSFFMVVIPLGFIVTFFPSFLLKTNAQISTIKYVCVISIGLIIGILASNRDVGVYITYILMPLLSALYFDKKFTKNVAIFGAVILTLGLWFRAPGMVELEAGVWEGTVFDWYLAKLIGYYIEYIVVAVFLVSLTGRARKLLESLSDADKMNIVTQEMSSVSRALSAVLAKLGEAIVNSREHNESVTNSADLTLERCNQNIEEVAQTVDGVRNMADMLGEVKEQTDSLTEMSETAHTATIEYEGTMENLVASMQKIESASKETETAVNLLTQNASQITGFNKTIQAIAGQTKILSINASIESARAGELGKGFAIVAKNVGELATQSQDAANHINTCVNEINLHINEVRDAVLANIKIVNEGIEKIEDARLEAKKMEELQRDVKHLTESVSESCQKTKETGNRMIEMSEHMRGLTAESVTAVSSIKEHTLSQTDAIQSIQDVFSEVDALTERLLNIG